MQPSALSEILNGKRRVSSRLAQRIIVRLALGPLEAQAILGLFEKEKKLRLPPGDHTLKSTPLTADQFHLVADWFHFALLCLMETRGFQSDIRWMARRLRVPPSEIKKALARMERLKMIDWGRDGHYRLTGSQFTTTDDVADISMRRAHSEDLRLAQESLDRDSVEERDFTNMTMAIDPGRIPHAKKLIREFRDSLCAYLEGGEKKEVYKMAFHLFPLTAPEEEFS